MGLLPALEHADGGQVPQSPLGNVVIVEAPIAPKHGVQIRPRVGVRGAQDFADAPVEALHHAIGLWPARRREAVLDAMARAELIEGVLPRGLSVTPAETTEAPPKEAPKTQKN